MAHRLPPKHDIPIDVGLTESEIVRVAQRISFGQDLSDVRLMYVEEGKDPLMANLAYCAAVTYLKINNKPSRAFRLGPR